MRIRPRVYLVYYIACQSLRSRPRTIMQTSRGEHSERQILGQQLSWAITPSVKLYKTPKVDTKGHGTRITMYYYIMCTLHLYNNTRYYVCHIKVGITNFGAKFLCCFPICGRKLWSFDFAFRSYFTNQAYLLSLLLAIHKFVYQISQQLPSIHEPIVQTEF